MIERRDQGCSRARPATAAAALAAAALLAAGVLLAACSRPGPPAGATGQVFRFRLREDPPTLDPMLSTEQLSEAVLFGLFRGLVELDPETLEVQPAIAASWEISPDRRTYTFHLRDDVVFHNGRKVTAADVAYSFQRLLRKDTGAPRRYVLEPLVGAADFVEGRAGAVAGLQTPDERTVVLVLDRPYAPFLGMLTMLAAAVVPREVYDDPGKAYLRAPVGCGPFRFSRWEQSNFIELLAFDRYYGGRPALDRVVVRIIENWNGAMQEYLAGGLDSLDQPPTAGEQALRAGVASEIVRHPFIGTSFIGFNLEAAPFRNNVNLRKAINYGVDKRYIDEVLFPDKNIPANGIIPPGVPGHDPDLPGYPYDAARARSLLAQAGYPGGAGLPSITLWLNTSEDNRLLGQAIQNDLKRIGIDLTLREVDWAAYLPAIEGTAAKPGQAQMFRYGWYLDYPDADAILRPLLHSASIGPAGNYVRYRNPRFDSLLDQALALIDPDARAALYREAERIAVMEDAALLLLDYYQETTLFKPYVKDVVLSPLGEFRTPLEKLRIERSPS